MAFLIILALVAALMTTIAARLLVTYRPAGSVRSHVVLASLSFPTLSVLLFALATALGLADSARIVEPGGSGGMVIFALAFFLFYALCVGVVVGIPTAIVAVRSFRER